MSITMPSGVAKMNRLLKLLFALFIGTFPLAAQSAKPSAAAGEEPRKVTYCELATAPGAYNHELVRLTAFVTHGFEDFSLVEPNCAIPNQNFSIWVMYGGKVESNTAYCCPGETGRTARTESLMVEGVQIPLTSDVVFRQFTNLLSKERDTTVRVAVAGRFFSGGKETLKGSTGWGGFGHLGCCSLFVIQRVEAFEPHTRRDVDYSAEAGSYEKEGCSSSSVQDLRHVSMSFSDGTAEQAIAEQAMADSGAQAWAFNDPERVAVESLTSFYGNRVPVLRNVKKASARQVFQWKDGKKSVVIVVTKPYWLSFYSKSGSVAWVSTTIKEADCE